MSLRCLTSPFWVFIAWLLVGDPVAYAQEFGHQWHQMDQNSGISELQNAFFSTDRFDRIWISSLDGLNCFDGRQIKQYHFVMPNQESDPYISSKVFEDIKGDFWCTSAGGIYCLKRGTNEVLSWQIKVGKDSMPAKYHSGIYLEHDSIFWVMADDQLYLFNTRSKTAHFKHDLTATRCYPILNKALDVKGLAISFFKQGIEIINYPDQGPPIREQHFQPGNKHGEPVATILNFVLDQDALAWIPSSIGLLRFDLKAKSFQLFNPEKTSKGIFFSDATLWQNDFIWLSSVGAGLYLFSIRDNQFVFNERYVRANNQVHEILWLNNIYLGPGGTLWLANWKKEILYASLKGAKFQHFLQNESTTLSSNEVTSIACDSLGDLWCGMSGTGLYRIRKRLDERTVSSHLMPDFYPRKSGINHLFCDEESNLWQITRDELSYRTMKTGRIRKVRAGNKDYRKMIRIRKHQYLVLTYKGFIQLEKKGRKLLSSEISSIGFSANDVISMLACKDGKIFASLLSNEIVELAISQNTLHIINTIKEVGFVNDLMEDQSGDCLWGASSAGLLKISKSGEKTPDMGIRNQLAQAFNAILQDDSGNLWLSSNAGLFKFNPIRQEVKHYTGSDGLQGLQFMLGSACKLGDGRLAFGGVNGINLFHPDNIRDNPNPPLLHFTDWIINDSDSISTSPEFLPLQSFTYDRRTLTFHFIGIDYVAPEEVQYKYRLKGFENDTVFGGLIGFARYAQIPSGAYTFQVWAANSDGVWTTEPHELHFEILPPWYATWWAYSIEFALLIGFLYAFYRSRINAVRRLESERRKEAEFRQKEAESKQLAAELQNSVLRLQMNPHFIFNSMNSISSYILQKDIHTANDYLGRFAKLMRQILDLASKPLIPITDEIELLEQYMATEAMRFEHKFTWQIEVDNQIDPDEVMVPTMILQPFVENAIWHGFSQLPTAGTIEIGFLKQGNQLVCTVADNGIGRKASSHKKTEGHSSKALEITQQRLQLLGNAALNQTSLEIKDLFTPSGIPCGTRVEVSLPMDL